MNTISVKQFESRLDPTYRRVWSGSKLLAKLISKQQKSPLVEELIVLNGMEFP